MPEFIAIEPDVEVKGAAVLATLHGINKEHIMPVAERYGLSTAQADGWYLQQCWLDVLREIAHGACGGSLDLVSVGMEIPTSADWPPDVNNMEAALFSIDVAYHLNHRKGQIGHYKAVTIDSTHIDMICDNPYPCDFDYGIIFGTLRRWRNADVPFKLTHDPAQCRKRGDAACTYHVSWEIAQPHH